jgi:TonB family protein
MSSFGKTAKSLAIGTVVALCGLADRAGAEPRSIGIPHTCNRYYPPELQEQGIQGTTLLSFRVTDYGSVREIVVSETSGNKDLDAAAVFCAQHWRYKPATRNGRVIEVPWVAKVVWALPPEPMPAAANAVAKP